MNKKWVKKKEEPSQLSRVRPSVSSLSRCRGKIVRGCHKVVCPEPMKVLLGWFSHTHTE